MSVEPLTAACFDHALARTPVPLLVDFWAEGCAPCLAMLPVLEQIAAEHAAGLRVCKVRLDDAPALARRFHIAALPTLIVFVGGREAKRISGVIGRTPLLDELQDFLRDSPR